MTTAEPLRLMVYDKTCRRPMLPGLSTVWAAGGLYYKLRGHLHATRGVSSWSEALTWLVETAPEKPIAEVQFWGHGKWGQARIDGEPLDRSALSPNHELARHLDALAPRIKGGRVWFRTCETVGAKSGQDFAMHLSDRLGVHVAGHTYIIAYWQSGLHDLAPGDRPNWSSNEGIARGTAAEPRAAYWSAPRHTNTISMWRGDVPGWASSRCGGGAQRNPDPSPSAR